jgi:quinol monooxygenase YgiN
VITYVVKMTAQPGRRDELLAALQALVDGAADEPGTLVYSFHTVDGEPDVVCSYELFVDEDALAAHRDGPVVAGALPALGPLIASTTHWRGSPVLGKGLPE